MCARCSKKSASARFLFQAGDESKPATTLLRYKLVRSGWLQCLVKITVLVVHPGLALYNTPSLNTGNPNPFWLERYQDEFRLQAARPDFFSDETAEGLVTQQAKACRVPIKDNRSVDEEHPPYELVEQPSPEEVPVRHTSGGDMF